MAVTGKKRNKGIGFNRNSGYVFNVSQEAFESEGVNRTNKRQIKEDRAEVN